MVTFFRQSVLRATSHLRPTSWAAKLRFRSKHRLVLQDILNLFSFLVWSKPYVKFMPISVKCASCLIDIKWSVFIYSTSDSITGAQRSLDDKKLCILKHYQIIDGILKNFMQASIKNLYLYISSASRSEQILADSKKNLCRITNKWRRNILLLSETLHHWSDDKIGGVSDWPKETFISKIQFVATLVKFHHKKQKLSYVLRKL